MWKLPKIVYGDSVFENSGKNDCINCWSGKFFFTGSIIGPAMAGPTGLFATALHNPTIDLLILTFACTRINLNVPTQILCCTGICT